MSAWTDLLGSISNVFQIGLGTGQKTAKFGDRGSLSWNPTANRVITLPDSSGEIALAGGSGGSALVANKTTEQTFLNNTNNLVVWENIVSSSNLIVSGDKTTFFVQSDGTYLIYVGFQLYAVDKMRRVVLDVMSFPDNKVIGRISDIGSGNISVFDTLYLGGSRLFSFAASASFYIRLYPIGSNIKNYFSATEVELNEVRLTRIS